jgi:Icc-related predicted phosphoesterase
MPITFQIASDIHLEHRENQSPNITEFITPSANILILAGDIGSLYKIDQLYAFLHSACQSFDTVLYTPGNNEYYTPKDKSSFINPLSFEELNNRLYELESKLDNLIIMNNSSVQIDNVCFIGATLWSDVKTYIPKFIVRIHDMTANKYSELYKNDLKYIDDMLSFCKKQKLIPVVITHHVPSYSLLPESRKDYKYASLYASHLDDYIEKSNAKIWISGHIHRNYNLLFGKTRVLSNQLGKPSDFVRGYSKTFVVSI